MGSKLHQILSSSFENYHRQNGTPWPVRSVIERVLKCRTEKLGGYKWVCRCGNEKIVYRSCRSRSCPQCGDYELKKFIDSKMHKIFPGDHFHVVFTIPSELNPLWLHNTRMMGTILFSSVKKTIERFTDDKKFLGAKPGIIMALHTWGQNLSLHPHIHALITAGGIDKSGQVRYCRDNFLFPAKAAMKYFRFVFLSEVKKHFKNYIHLPSIVDTCYSINWNIFIKEKYRGGRGVFLYLSRYIRGLPIKDSRIKHFDTQQVTFSYKDYRDGKKKLMKMSINNFLQRLLLHIPPKGFRTYRESGLYYSDKIVAFKFASSGGLLSRQYFENNHLDVRFEGIQREEICPKCKNTFDRLIVLDVPRYPVRGSPERAA